MFSGRIKIEIRLHLDVSDAVEVDLAKRLPMEPLKKSSVLVLHVSEKCVAAQCLRGGNGFVN